MRTFGYTPDDITTWADGVTPKPGVQLYVWAAEVGGAPLLNFYSSANGSYGWTYDTTADGLWLSAGLDGARWYVEAHEAVAALRDRVDTTETRLGGVEDELPLKLDVAAANSTYAAKSVETDVAAKLDATTAAATYAKPAVPGPVLALTKTPPPVDAAAYLRPWHTALGRRTSRRANVVFVGDSWTEGQGATNTSKRFTDRLAAGLRTKFGVTGGGRGFISADSSTNSWSDYPAVIGNPVSQFTDYSGPNLYTRAMKPGASTTTVTYSLNGTSADVLYPMGPSYGSISWAVDGGAATNIAQANATVKAGQKTTVSLGTAGAHSLVLTGVTSGSFLNGVIEYNGDENAGIMVHSAGHGGYKAGDYSANVDPVKHWPAAVNALRPDLVVVEVGINDENAAVAVATFKANLTTMVTAIRAALAAPAPVVLFIPPACIGNAATWPPYAQAIYDVSVEQGCLVADLSLRIPNRDDAQTYGMWAPSSPLGDFHLSNDGHQAVADALTGFLTP